MREAARFEIQLIHIYGSLKGEISTFKEDQITIGREHASLVKFPPDEQGVSRNHAVIQREGNQFRLIDNSKYGTFVNGKQAGEGTFLRSGDVLEIGPGGPKISFHAEIVEDAADVPTAGTVLPPVVEKARPEPPPVHAPPEAPLKAPPVSAPQQPQPLAPPPPVAPPPPRPPMQPEKVAVPLVIQFGPAIRSYRELPVVIGSDAHADFVLQFPGVSGRHLQLFYSHGSYWVKNLTGVGIVAVNQMKLDTQVQLKPFDEIECCPGGPTFRFIGEGRLVEVEREQTDSGSVQNAPAMAAAGSAQPKSEEGGFFSKFVKGFKK